MYDLIIVGLGPAGINACIYAKRSTLKVLVIEKGMPGGMLHKIEHVENYLGYKGINGSDLAMEFYKQFMDLNLPMVNEEVEKIINNDNCKTIITNGGEYNAKAVIIATGRGPKKLGIENENMPGVSNCVICDANLYKNKTVAIYGNNPKTIESALYLSNIAKEVYLITSNSKTEDIVNQVNNIKVLLNEKIIKINGTEKIESIELKNQNIKVDGLFIENDFGPQTDFVSELNITNKKGYIIVNNSFETSIPGIFACGDSIEKGLYQIITAAADGATAAISAYKYIKTKK